MDAENTSLAYIAQCIALLDQVDAALPAGTTYTTAAKKMKAKARKGSEQFAPQLVSLARQYGVTLSLVPTEAIEANAAEALALVPLVQRVERLNKRVADRLFETRSSSWSDASKLYTVLKRLSRDVGDLQKALLPVQHFFNKRHPLVRKTQAAAE